MRNSAAERVRSEDLIALGLKTPEARRLSSEVNRLLGTCSSVECWRRISGGLLSPAHPFPVHQLLHRTVFDNERETGPPPIFVPAPDSIQESNLARIQEQLGLDSYAELHSWTVVNRSGYWELMIRHLGIRFRTPPVRILDSTPDVENVRWLPGARLNIAESCFDRGAEPAVVYQREGAPLSSLTRKELDSLSNRVANALPLLGVDRGDSVAIDMPMNVEAVAIYLGIIKAGCVALTIAESFSAPEVRTRLRVGEAKALFTQDRILRGSRELPLYTRMTEAGAPVTVVVPAQGRLSEPLREGDLSWDDFLCDNDVFQAVACDPDDAINILFSSGTTGEPKAIPFTHLTPIKCAADGCLHQDIREGDVVAWPTSLGWMMGPWLIYASLINGATIALFDGIPTSRSFCEFVQDAKVNVLGVVPTLVGVWRAGGCAEGLDWSSVRVFTSTGECSNPDDMHYLTSRAGYRPVVEYCGGTEIGGAYITGTVVQTSVASAFSTAALGMSLTILDRRGDESDQGEIFIVPPSIGLSTRLLNRNHHREYFAGTPQGPGGILLRRHGDRMERLDNGYYRAQGRIDDTMNLGGIKVGSAEIERVLNRVPGIGETAAVAVSPPGGGATRLVVYVVLATPDPAFGEEGLLRIFQRAIADRLNPLFRLHDVKVVRQMPRTASNKILRRQLRSRYSGPDS